MSSRPAGAARSASGRLHDSAASKRHLDLACDAQTKRVLAARKAQ
jgi:hypothetical protein